MFDTSYASDSDSCPEYDDYPSRHELDLLHHKSDELGIMLNPELNLYECSYYTIASIVDPGELYVIDENGDWNVKQLLLEKEMHDFYTTPNWKENYKIKTCRVFVRRVYAWYNNEIPRWERVRVIHVEDMAMGKVFIKRIDYGNNILVNIVDLMEMNPKFCFKPPLSSRAHLVHVQPVNEQTEWSQEAVRFMFKLFEKGGRFRGAIFSTLKMSCTKDSRGIFETTKSLGLVVIVESLKTSIQSILVRNGLAEGTGVGAGYSDLLFPSDTYPTLEDALLDMSENNGSFEFTNSLKNASNDSLQSDYILSTESVQTTLAQGYENFTEILKNEALQTELSDDLEEIPNEIKNCLGWISFCHIIGPGKFYAQMMPEKDALISMMLELGRKVENTTNLNASNIRPGQFIAVFYDGPINYRMSWYRAFVNETRNTILNAKVILVDFGIECSVNYENIRRLPEEFLNPRPFCRRVHLICPHMTPAGNISWTSAANRAFIDYINAWSIEDPVYLCFMPKGDERSVELNYFNEDLRYCQITKSWTTGEVASSMKTFTEQKSVNKFKNHNLLKYLFTSLGISIHYEVKSKMNECYQFVPVWDNLMEHGHLFEDID